MDLYHGVDLSIPDQAPFMLGHLYHKFPVGTVHISLVGVSSSVVMQPKVMCMQGHYFIALNSYDLRLISAGCGLQAEIREWKDASGECMQKIANLAAACASGSWEEKSSVYESSNLIKPMEAAVDIENGKIVGHVVYVDQHNNIVTDIPATHFRDMLSHYSKFSATIGTTKVNHFHDGYDNDIFSYFMPNELAVMQIVTYGGKVTLLPRWAWKTPIEISFQK